jgi:hypothetical protein
LRAPSTPSQRSATYTLVDVRLCRSRLCRTLGAGGRFGGSSIALLGSRGRAGTALLVRNATLTHLHTISVSWPPHAAKLQLQWSGRQGLIMAASFDNPEHWRNRATEMLALANEVLDPVAKCSLLQAAEQYDHLAIRAEERLRNRKPPA